MRQGLANFELVEGWLLRVEHEVGVDAIRFVHEDFVVGIRAHRVGIGNRHSGDDVSGFGSEVGRQGLGLFQSLDHEGVQVGKTLVPVAVETLAFEWAAGDPFHQLERAGAGGASFRLSGPDLSSMRQMYQ
jgi:hypothetical protein